MVIHPLQGGVHIFRPVGADLGGEELRPDEVAQHLLQRLAVLLIDTEQEEGQHQADHQQGRALVADAAPGEDVGRYADQTARAEANELALGQVERYLCFYSGEVFGNRDKRHLSHLPIFRFCSGLVAKDRLCRQLCFNRGLTERCGPIHLTGLLCKKIIQNGVAILIYIVAG